MSADIGALIPGLQQPAQELVNLAGRAGVQPRVTSTFRTHSQQQRLYEAFLRGQSQYPVAPPGTSAHEYGYAFDMIAASQVDLHDLGTVWRSWGGVWSPEDEVHFEYPGFNPATAKGPERCGTIHSLLVQAIDLVGPSFLGPTGAVINAVELGAWLASLGFPQSEILKFLQSPLTYLSCG